MQIKEISSEQVAEIKRSFYLVKVMIQPYEAELKKIKCQEDPDKAKKLAEEAEKKKKKAEARKKRKKQKERVKLLKKVGETERFTGIEI